MFTVRFLIGALFAACFCLGNYDNALASHNFFAPELKPVSDSYKIAKSTFLPDADGDLGLSGHSISKYDHNYGDNCAAYPLTSCPTGATCSPCPFNHSKLRMTSCTSPYISNGSTCVCPATANLICANDKCNQYCGSTCIKKSCTKSANQTGCTNGTQACDDGCCGTSRQCCKPCTDTVTSKPENSEYTTTPCTDGGGTKNIKTGWKCSSGYHKVDSSCVKDCNATNCAGYTLNACPANGTCSSCTITAANCSTNGTKYRLDSCASGYTVSGDICIEGKPDVICNSCLLNTSICNGKANTAILYKKRSNPGQSCYEFYVGSKTDANFGASQWYLPAIGELMDASGFQIDKMDSESLSGGIGSNAKLLRLSDTLWSSSDVNTCDPSPGQITNSTVYCRSWSLSMSSGYLNKDCRSCRTRAVRCFNFLENKFTTSAHPEIGDKVFTDMTYSSTDNSSKTVAGLVTWVSTDGKSVKIINVANLTFPQATSTYGFNPENPYGQKYYNIWHSSSDQDFTDYDGIDNYDADLLYDTIKQECKNTGDWVVGDEIPDIGCSLNEMPLYCNGNQYCCPSSAGYKNCTDMENGTYKCYAITIDMGNENINTGCTSSETMHLTCYGLNYCCTSSAVFAGVGEDKCEKIQTSGLPEGCRNIGTYDF